MLPRTVDALLERLGTASALSGSLTKAVACEGAKFHSPTPLLVRAVRLCPEEWGCENDTTVWLCGTCEANISVLQHLLHSTEGALSWEVRREFGNLLRALALRGWDLYVEERERDRERESERRRKATEG